MSRYWIFLLLCFSLALPLALDYASFRYAKSLDLVELYYSVPYQDLVFHTENETISANVRIDYAIHSFQSPDSVTDSAYRHLTLPSFKRVQERDLRMIDQVVFYARPGKYWFNFTARSPDSASLKKIGFRSDTLVVGDFSDSLSLSDIELAVQIARDTSEGRFNKSGLRIMPNPSGQFGSAYELINVYFEVYNMVPDSEYFEATYAILDSNQLPVKTFPPEKRRKEGSSLSLTFALSAKGLKPGTYFLGIRLKDMSTGKEVTKNKRFLVVSPAATGYTQATYQPSNPEELHYYEAINLIATEKEIKQFKSLTGDARKKFLTNFWAKRDFTEFMVRAQYADLHFGFGSKEGSETDRGRIYVKYGQPDDVEDLPMTEYSNPQQRWRYYKKGWVFVFVDITGNGYLQFIYSNTGKERNYPDWKRYVNEEEFKDQ